MNTFNIITGPARSGKTTFVKRHAKDSDVIIDELSEPCIVIDRSKTHNIYWLVIDPTKNGSDYFRSLHDQLTLYGQVNHIKIGSLTKFV